MYDVPPFVDALHAFADSEGLVDAQTTVQRLPYLPESRPSYPRQLVDRLAAAEPGTRMVVGHPGYFADDTRRITGGRYDRGPGEWAGLMDGQRRMFLDQEVLDYCEANDVEPIRFTDL